MTIRVMFFQLNVNILKRVQMVLLLGPTHLHGPTQGSVLSIKKAAMLCRRINICEFVTHLTRPNATKRQNCVPHILQKNVWRFRPQPWMNFLIFLKNNSLHGKHCSPQRNAGKLKKEFVFKIFKPRYPPSYVVMLFVRIKLAFIKTNSYYLSLVNFFLKVNFHVFLFANQLKI